MGRHLCGKELKIFNLRVGSYPMYTLSYTVYVRFLPMLAVRIPAEMEARLDQLAQLTGRPKSFYVRKAIETHLAEIEETYTALYRLENPSRRWTLDELEQGRDEQP